jgi:Ca2+-binding EF-hand superfamily protein
VYSLFDPKNKGFVSKESFLVTCQRLLSLEAEQKIKLVFDLIDFNSDGVIERDDIWTLLCHLPLQKSVDLLH